MNLRKWKNPALFVDQTLHGFRLCISYPSSQVDGNHAATTDGLMLLPLMTDILSLTLKTLIRVWQDLSSSPKLTWLAGITRFNGSLLYSQNNYFHAVWIMGVLTYTVWTKKHCAALSKTYEWRFSEPRLWVIYLDDILVASKSESQHRDHLKTIFELVSANGLVINKSKCAFGVTEFSGI